MDLFSGDSNHTGSRDGHNKGTDTNGTPIQLALSITLGIGAFITFCVLRPRWKELYAARKRQKNEASALPELPDTLFGWVPILWRIDEGEVLASAGLDAFAFLAFFKMALKFLAIALFFAITVFEPVHRLYPDKPVNFLKNGTTDTPELLYKSFEQDELFITNIKSNEPAPGKHQNFEFLWMYLVFAYVFTAILIYLIIKETTRISGLRQDYLGNQSTITDRTFLLSGIPKYLRAEEKIKEFVEELEIGKVDSVILCRSWYTLDKLVAERSAVLRKLEKALIESMNRQKSQENFRNSNLADESVNNNEDDHDDANESSNLLSNGRNSLQSNNHERPVSRIWHGPLNLQSTKVDAINHYRTLLRVLDGDIRALRDTEFEPRPLAFVTMDSVASCQMAQQAVLDPSPLQLLARPSPAPADVVWENTYLSRPQRMIRSWAITIFISFLTIFWSIVFVPIAGAVNYETIKKVFPHLAKLLFSNPTLRSLVQTQLPTIITALLNAAVPYLYDWLANYQGSISQAEVELSVISKNFFFTFFNFFIVFTFLRTASSFLDFYYQFGNSLRDPSIIAKLLAYFLQDLLQFYQNYIILQGIGLYPLRLLETGSMILYPLYSAAAKTPRDHSELTQPPVFSYGFYLPQTLLIFMICVIYSVLRSSWKIILSGLIYFALGHFVHKYQLLYAMDHQHHSTGRAWMMMCNRVYLGTILFQFSVLGQMALRAVWTKAAAIVPLLILTTWSCYKYNKTFKPLFNFIALKKIKRAEHGQELEDDILAADVAVWRDDAETRHRETVDESREKGLRYINPSLVSKLEKAWTPPGHDDYESDEESV